MGDFGFEVARAGLLGLELRVYRSPQVGGFWLGSGSWTYHQGCNARGLSMGHVLLELTEEFQDQCLPRFSARLYSGKCMKRRSLNILFFPT